MPLLGLYQRELLLGFGVVITTEERSSPRLKSSKESLTTPCKVKGSGDIEGSTYRVFPEPGLLFTLLA